MKKKRNNNLAGIALLLLYVFSITPTLLIHQHADTEVIAFSDADPCEKAIYYGIRDSHRQHVSDAREKCWFCDHHTITPQILFDTEIALPQVDFYTEYFCSYKSYRSIEVTNIPNKGPPFYA
ncbi:MAG: hypothetical protein M9933_00545 [Chitinophagaceae bacterium]|nr:hypothetical protein [Chitinophagaceae bacterium]